MSLSGGPSGFCSEVSRKDPSPAPPAGRSFARQPILDVRGRVVAYELLFRSAAGPAFKGSGDVASQIMIDNTLLYGLAKLTAGLPAFINCTADTLSGDFIQMLPPPFTVLEVLETVEPSPEVVDACTRLQRKGYKIALDDFDYRPSLDPLIRIADIIKMDFRSTPASERRRLIASLRDFKGEYLAEKVETREEYEDALKEGFTLFQGYYFCKPAILKKTSVPSNRFVHLRLLKLMQKTPLDVSQISGIVKSEPSLAYRLLRYVNSAGSGMRQEITSIKTALLAIGDDLFRRMATLAVAVELNSGPSPEILRIALVRARFCETAAALCKLNSTEQYLLGLFSLLDAMLQMPMQDALAPLSLAAPIRAALLGADNSYRCPLYWLESYERGDFSRCDELAVGHGFDPSLLEQNFVAAALWADELLAEN
jgi:EAL and modified HD-GYP domain-containing signal transduction protein